MLQQSYQGFLNFATDAWTSPDHQPFVAITVHFVEDGAPATMLLDLVKVSQKHTGINLAAVFASVLEDFGIKQKVSVHYMMLNDEKLTGGLGFSNYVR